jgi:hypothetical protein
VTTVIFGGSSAILLLQNCGDIGNNSSNDLQVALALAKN